MKLSYSDKKKSFILTYHPSNVSAVCPLSQYRGKRLLFANRVFVVRYIAQKTNISFFVVHYFNR